jgi:hypothetical protein
VKRKAARISQKKTQMVILPSKSLETQDELSPEELKKVAGGILRHLLK